MATAVVRSGEHMIPAAVGRPDELTNDNRSEFQVTNMKMNFHETQ